MKSLTASCLCGAVALSLPDRFDYQGNCHCSECRKFSGADYAPVGGLDGALVTITRGEKAISRFQKSPRPPSPSAATAAPACSARSAAAAS